MGFEQVNMDELVAGPFVMRFMVRDAFQHFCDRVAPMLEEHFDDMEASLGAALVADGHEFLIQHHPGYINDNFFVFVPADISELDDVLAEMAFFLTRADIAVTQGHLMMGGKEA